MPPENLGFCDSDDWPAIGAVARENWAEVASEMLDWMLRWNEAWTLCYYEHGN